jgi:hypothetical protein
VADEFHRPGPPFIEPGRCPGGVVVRVYAIPSETLVIEQCLGPGDDVEGAATIAAALDMPGWAACLVAYDGDTGHRAGPLEWGTSIG